MLNQILRWADKKNSVRAVILVGSLANTGKHDNLSDYDISIFGGGFDYIEKNDWLEDIAPHILCIHEKFFWGNDKIPTRLTIFENFTKIDFAFHPIALLAKMANDQLLSDTYDAGYQVLLDKDGLTVGLPKPSFLAYIIEKPSPQDYDRCVREFWFEAYHVAKYLKREDLWVAQLRDHDMKKWLLTILEWNAAAKAGFELSIKRDGKAMNDWISPNYKEKLENCFAGWNLTTQRSALYETMELFGTVARETAGMLQYHYLENIDHDIKRFVSTLIIRS